MNYKFRSATESDADKIWQILEQAIARRKADGSTQWQDGYPNPEVVTTDIQNRYGYVLTDGDNIAGYCAIMVNNEPAYEHIDGAWLTNNDFVVYHRVAVSEAYLGKGVAKEMLLYIEEFAKSKNINSVKVDTNFDNAGMLALLHNFGYVHCGEVIMRGGIRMGFEKIL
ncbi:GNAT family N-acetyltransferase [Flavobacterium sp. RNTU_13]|uniref:GNAT family N-acetyltransferase n=1 Tax=Flavobacterium sp. RNTU_13 TaxID=3375145 RepID=UPI003987EE31